MCQFFRCHSLNGGLGLGVTSHGGQNPSAQPQEPTPEVPSQLFSASTPMLTAWVSLARCTPGVPPLNSCHYPIRRAFSHLLARRHGVLISFPLWKVQGGATPQDCGGTLRDLGPLPLAPRLSLEYYSPPGCGELPHRDWAWERRQASGRAGTFFGEAAAGAASGKTQRNCLGGKGGAGSHSSGQEERDSSVRQLFRPSPEPAPSSASPSWALPFLPAAHCRAQLLSNPELQFNTVCSGFVKQDPPAD